MRIKCGSLLFPYPSLFPLTLLLLCAMCLSYRNVLRLAHRLIKQVWQNGGLFYNIDTKLLLRTPSTQQRTPLVTSTKITHRPSIFPYRVATVQSLSHRLKGRGSDPYKIQNMSPSNETIRKRYASSPYTKHLKDYYSRLENCPS